MPAGTEVDTCQVTFTCICIEFYEIHVSFLPTSRQYSAINCHLKFGNEHYYVIGRLEKYSQISVAYVKNPTKSRANITTRQLQTLQPIDQRLITKQ